MKTDTRRFTDQQTAAAFSTSWNNLPKGSIYTDEQFEDWFYPIQRPTVEGKTVLELGCGNGSLLLHLLKWRPKLVDGIDLGDSVLSAQKNLAESGFKNWSIHQQDMNSFGSDGYDLVFSIGVIHHLTNPKSGFDAVIRNVKPGGRFHCWVYAREGNRLIILVIDPIRRITSKLPWWLTKYLIAAPLAVIFYLYANILGRNSAGKISARLPLYKYCKWISARGYRFFLHVVFDQLVSPRTVYLERATIESWLKMDQSIDQQSIYIIMRNGNSWKFGGTLI